MSRRSEELFLELVNISKAFVGLIDHSKQGRIGADAGVVLANTGGNPAVFAGAQELLAG